MSAPGNSRVDEIRQKIGLPLAIVCMLIVWFMPAQPGNDRFYRQSWWPADYLYGLAALRISAGIVNDIYHLGIYSMGVSARTERNSWWY